jgi:hypothetical protein
MKYFLLLALALSGCASNGSNESVLVPGEVKTVVKVERVVVKPPAELLLMPTPVMPLNVNRATQRDVAEWILKSEERTLRLEEQLNAIIKWSNEVHE